MATARIIAVCACAGLLAGCADRYPWEGEWVGNYPLPPNQVDDPVAVTLSRVRLTVQPDGTFVLVEAGFDKYGDFIDKGRSARLVIKRVIRDPAPDGQERALVAKGPDEAEFRRPGIDPIILRRTAQR